MRMVCPTGLHVHFGLLHWTGVVSSVRQKCPRFSRHCRVFGSLGYVSPDGWGVRRRGVGLAGHSGHAGHSTRATRRSRLTPNLPTNIVGFKGFDSSINNFKSKGWNAQIQRGFPGNFDSSNVSIGTMLVGGLGVSTHPCGRCRRPVRLARRGARMVYVRFGRPPEQGCG